MEDCLVKIEPDDLFSLCNLYQNRHLEHYVTYATIENYIKWFKLDPEVNHVNFYCLNGDFSDGTFVVVDWRTTYADTLDSNHDNLYRLLKLIDFSNGFTFLNVRPEIGSVIEEILEEAEVEIVDDDMTLLYYLPKEKALEFDVDPLEGIELRQLTEIEDLEKINALWPHRTSMSLCDFKRMAKYNPSIGAFKNGELAAWILRLPNGLLGTLQTDENHFGYGYGSLVTRALSRKIAEMGFDIFADIYEDNMPSRTLFEKLGFESICEVRWIRTEILDSIEAD